MSKFDGSDHRVFSVCTFVTRSGTVMNAPQACNHSSRAYCDRLSCDLSMCVCEFVIQTVGDVFSWSDEWFVCDGRMLSVLRRRNELRERAHRRLKGAGLTDDELHERMAVTTRDASQTLSFSP